MEYLIATRNDQTLSGDQASLTGWHMYGVLFLEQQYSIASVLH